MITIKIHPVSVNEAYRGRRFKSDKYAAFEKELLYQLPKSIGDLPEKLELVYYFGLSSKNCDLGNYEKICTDILCKKYGFNDKNIYRILLTRIDVKKGEEFIGFLIQTYG